MRDVVVTGSNWDEVLEQAKALGHDVRVWVWRPNRDPLADAVALGRNCPWLAVAVAVEALADRPKLLAAKQFVTAQLLLGPQLHLGGVNQAWLEDFVERCRGTEPSIGLDQPARAPIPPELMASITGPAQRWG